MKYGHNPRLVRCTPLTILMMNFTLKTREIKRSNLTVCVSFACRVHRWCTV